MGIDWNRLVERHQKRAFITALAVTRNIDDAEEITQEAFVRLFSNIEKIKDENAIGQWLMRTSYNLASDQQRYKRIRGWFSFKRDDELGLNSGNQPVDGQISSHQFVQIARGWMRANLSRQEGVVLQLKAGEEMTFEEISSSLKMNLSTVKTHYYRAVKKMDRLKEDLKREV